MTARDPTKWMWAEACELLAQAERMHRRFFELAAPVRGRPVWEPPVDVFEDEHTVVVVVALPGVAANRIEVKVEPQGVTVRAQRELPPGGARREIRRLEIPYGRFERRIGLSGTRVEAAGYEVADGCLIVRLRKQD